MTTMTLQKLDIELHAVKREVQSLRELVIGMSLNDRDPEGEYRPEFVKRILAAKKEKPIGKFSGAKSFLAALENQKA